MRLVLLPDGLYLRAVKLDENNEVVFGQVVNGGWEYRSNGVTAFSYMTCDDDLLGPVTHHPYEAQRKVLIPAHFENDYNSAIEWAKVQPPSEVDWQAELDRVALEDINKKKCHSGFEDMDDDMPF